MASDVHVLGDGVAAMMLAARADELGAQTLSIVRPDGAPAPKDHMLGFWATPGLEDAAKHTRHSWSTWSVISDDATASLVCEHQPYHVMHKAAFLERCRVSAVKHGVRFVDEATHADARPQSVFDTRPPRAPENAMLQHFVGLEVELNQPAFDPTTAVLMDFRVDQSNGMHFMYVLPFSATTALVESTMFSTRTMPRDFYVDAIETYLFTHHNAGIKTVLREEQGVIPMGSLSPHDPNIPGLGANGGAIRPASGYTFAFIHEQVQTALDDVRKGRALKFKRPHKRIDVWMDGVLLTVLRHWPHYAPNLFTRMAQGLTGEEFIRFMTGNASWRLRFKVMRAMPKVPFIRGVSKWMFSRPQKVVQ